jgi:hypothetical protein
MRILAARQTWAWRSKLPYTEWTYRAEEAEDRSWVN